MLSVTDHSLVRYIERVAGIDLELIRDEIRALAADGSPCVVVEGETVVTVLGHGMRRFRNPARNADQLWDAYTMEDA